MSGAESLGSGAESLGKAVLDLQVNSTEFRKDMQSARREGDDMQRTLDALAAVSKIAEDALKQIKMSPGQGAETRVTAEGIVSGVRGISEEARTAARELDHVKLTEAQAAETRISADVQAASIKKIGRQAEETTAKLDVMNASAAGGGAARAGAPGGGGFGLMGAAIGGGALLAPAAGPGAMGLLASVPVLAGAAAGSLGVLALAFQGVTKAIGGDKKAFDDLGPAAQAFVETVRSLDGFFDKLKETAAGSLFPGLTAGLKAALSPGTISAITTAITALGHALGQAGELFGRYFGSAEFQSIFGPLMQSAARTIGNLSAAALKLFDAIGVVARAAIPFTDWMTTGIARGAQLVDSWLHAKDATGQLGGAMNEAKTSLELVGRLLGSLINAVGSLGSALYPVSKVAVKDLTDGFNALAGIIDRNKQTIRDIVSSALAALVSTIKFLVPVVTDLFRALESVVHSIGGWKVAFEIIIGGMLAAKVVALGGKFYDLAGSIASIGPRLAGVGVEAEAVAGEVGGLRAALLGLGAPEVLAAIGAAVAAYAGFKFLQSQAQNITSQSGGNFTSKGVNYSMGGGRVAGRNVGSSITGSDGLGPDSMRGAFANRFTVGGISGPGDFQDESSWLKTALTALSNHYGKINLISGYRSQSSQDGLWDASIKAGHPGFMPNGNPIARPANRGGAGSDHTRGTAADGNIMYRGQWIPLSSLPASVLQKFGLTTVPGDRGHVQLINQPADGGSSASPFGTIPPFTTNLGSKPPKPTPPTGANLLTEALRNALQTSKDNAKTAASPSAAATWLHAELGDLEKAKKDLSAELAGSSGKKRAAIQAELRSIDGQISSVNKEITTNLKAQASAIKASYSQALSTARGNISSAFSLVKAALDAQLQQQTQDYIDNVLGPKFFQGTDEHGMSLQTPLEKQLADMQSADTLKQLQDAVTGATDPAAQAAAQRQLDEYNLSIAASKERAQADHDYTEAVKAWQAAQTEKQRQMDVQLDEINKGLQNGTKSLGDLATVAGSFGVSLTAPGGIVDDFSELSAATRAYALVLASEAKKLRGVGDTKDANKIQNIIDDLGGTGDPSASWQPGNGRMPTGPLIPMASGGIGRVTMPTLFYSAGDEDFAFSGEGRSFRDGVGGAGGETHTHVHIHGGTFIGGNKQQVARDLKPYLERIVTLTK